MSYEHKEPIPDQQPPQYGAQSPPPPMNQPMYPQQTGQTYAAQTPPADINRTFSGQNYPQQPMQQAQYAPPGQEHGQYPPQPQNQAYGQQQQPQQAYHQPPQPAHTQSHGQYPPQQGHQMQQTGSQYQTAVPLGALSSSPAPAQCPSCGQRAMTRTAFVTGNTTYGWAAGLCAVLCLGCIPFCMTSMKDVEHRCGNCGVHLATWHRSGRTEVHMYH